MTVDLFHHVETGEGPVREIDLALAADRFPGLAEAPFSTLVLAESLIRTAENPAAAVRALLDRRGDVAFRPARVLMQDYAGLPALLDVAALRERVASVGGDPLSVALACPVDLVVDHSIMAHAVGRGSDRINLRREYEENGARFSFLRWAGQAFDDLSVVPPGTGIVHQINLERLAEPVRVRDGILFPDSLIGTDSHSTMTGGLGVLGWGVGGIEAAATLLGLPVTIPPPPVIGVRLTGRRGEGVLATDVALRVTRFLREAGVVGCIVEFFGEGAAALSVPDRATIANMAPEYGATTGVFPPDARTVEHLRGSGRETVARRLEAYLARQPLLSRERPVRYDRVLEFDLSSVGVTVSGPALPHQTQSTAEVSAAVRAAGGEGDGAIVLAAITSCTNTANPEAVIAAALLARNALRAGLSLHPRIKASFSPGSRAVTAYLGRLGLLEPLEALGFAVAGYGCMTCVGNSGELTPEGEAAARDGRTLAAVLSGNRNFQARIHPAVRNNYLMSPPMVVAYALAGTVACDPFRDPIGPDGRRTRLADLWPDPAELAAAVAASRGAAEEAPDPEAEALWSGVAFQPGPVFGWPEGDTFFVPPRADPAPAAGAVLSDARPLLVLGDSVTTDHISPVGRIAPDSPAGLFLRACGVEPEQFGSYGARRGNPDVMRRGTFANPRLANALASRPGWWTRHLPDGAEMTIDECAARYAGAGTPAVVVAGKDYGIGSARDWAAKGTRALGVRAVLAKSFERIHRANLALVGVMPLVVGDLPALGDDALISIPASPEAVRPGATLPLVVTGGGRRHELEAICRLDTEFEVACWRAGGVLQLAAEALEARPAPG